MRSRTSNLLIRSQMLYPIELWLRKFPDGLWIQAENGPMVNLFGQSCLDDAGFYGKDKSSILSRVTEGLAR